MAADATLHTGRTEANAGAPGGLGAVRVAAFAMRESTGTTIRAAKSIRRGLAFRTTRPSIPSAVRARFVDSSRAACTADIVADARRESSDTASVQGLGASGAAGRSTAGAGADVEIALGAHVTAAAAVRLDQRWDQSEGARGSSEFSPTGHAGVEWAPMPAFALAAHAGRLARPASFLERFGDRGLLLGNAALLPERATTVDLGVRGHGRAGGGLRFSYELTGFATRADDLIAYVPYGSTSLRAENLAEARMFGVESTGMLAKGPVTTTFAYTALASANEGADALARGKPLPGRPAHDLSTDLTYAAGRVTLRYGMDVTAGTTLDPKGTIVLPTRVLHGAGATWEVPGAPGLRLGAEVQNLFDLRVGYVASPATGAPVAEPISDLLGFPLEGRTVWVSARYLSP